VYKVVKFKTKFVLNKYNNETPLFTLFHSNDWKTVYAGHRSHKKYLGISKIPFVNMHVICKNIMKIFSLCFLIFYILSVIYSVTIILNNL